MLSKTLSAGVKILSVITAFTLSGCVVPPPRNADVVNEQTVPEVLDVYVYPVNGQSAAQTDRDRYECNSWAVQQTHYDPALATNGQAPHIRVVAAPPGTSTAGGAITGAVIGAAVSNPRNAPGGALVGAVAGAIIGAAADQARQERVDEVQQEYNHRYAAQQRPAQDYRRALSACLEGRGYTIK